MALLELLDATQDGCGMLRACVLPVLVLMAMITPFPPCVYAQEGASEYQVKAAFLHNFGRFVQWPADSFPTSGSPMVIGVVGDDPSRGAFEDVLRGRTANGHPVQLRRLPWNDAFAGCHILFISASELQHLPNILKSLAGRSVLTVSDIDGFSLSGGMIEFRMVGSRVRFDINWAAAQNARLEVSAKLLNVARAVHADTAEGAQ